MPFSPTTLIIKKSAWSPTLGIFVIILKVFPPSLIGPIGLELFSNETIFSAALEQDPELIEQGVLNKVIHRPPLSHCLKRIWFIAREAKDIAALGGALRPCQRRHWPLH